MEKRQLATYSSESTIYTFYDRSTIDRYIVVASRPVVKDKFINHPITEDVAFYLIGKETPVENLEIHPSAPQSLEKTLRECMDKLRSKDV